MSTVYIGLKPTQGTWISKTVFLPDPLKDEWRVHRLSSNVAKLAQLFPDQLFAITSIWSSATGDPRKKTTSHYKGRSIDLAPLYSKDQAMKPGIASPNLCDNLRLATFIANQVYGLNMAVFLEDDHFHCELSYRPGAFLAIQRHSTYFVSWSDDPRLGKIFEVSKSGEVISRQPVLLQINDHFKN